MWVVAKIKNNSGEIFKSDISKKMKNIEFYDPKYKINFTTKNKTKILKKNLFNTYIFCNLTDYKKNTLEELKFCKGLEYYLNGFEIDQLSIVKFIKYCKSFEDDQKYITNTFFKNLIKTKGKFFSGPLKNIIFELVEKRKNKVIVSFGKFIATVQDSKTIYVPV